VGEVGIMVIITKLVPPLKQRYAKEPEPSQTYSIGCEILSCCHNYYDLTISSAAMYFSEGDCPSEQISHQQEMCEGIVHP
jgi:hypothetical protein